MLTIAINCMQQVATVNSEMYSNLSVISVPEDYAFSSNLSWLQLPWLYSQHQATWLAGELQFARPNTGHWNK